MRALRAFVLRRQDNLADGFGAAVADIRQKLIEEGWFGKAVTPRRQNISFGMPEADKASGDPLGRWQRAEQDRDMRNKKSPERGIDL